MNDIDREVAARRQALNDAGIPGGADRKWGLALSGGGIRSATFCFGVLRALASQKVLLRFDLLSTVSGGGYIGAMLGSLFNRAQGATDARRVQDAVGDSHAGWFLWWLRANGRYLIPRGTKDRTFAVALYLRNLTAVHFELGLIALLLGLALAAVDLGAWQYVDSLGYQHASRAFFGSLRWLPNWFPVVWFVLPAVAVVGIVLGAAYWALPWFREDAPIVWLWWLVLVADALLIHLYRTYGLTQSETGHDLRVALWCLCIGLISAWLVAVPVARTYLALAKPAEKTFPLTMVQDGTARNWLTRHLANCFRLFAIVVVIGLVDRVAWFLAFELDNVAGTGLYLAITAALLRSVLPLASSLVPGRRGVRGVLFVAQVLGYLLTFLLCAWWVSIVHKAVLGTLFTGRSLAYRDAWAVAALLAVPLLTYVIATGRNLEFLNLSSLHSFYRGRLVRSYLGAANGGRFVPGGAPLSALDPVPGQLTGSLRAQVDEVVADDDRMLGAYRPQAAGGPIHLINVCVNQTKDPRGGLFNQDRRGLPLAVASGGLMQVGQEGWVSSTGAGDLTVGTWMAISGAAISPGLGSLTRGGVSALTTFAGVRLGYWWSKAKRMKQAGQKSPLLAKSRGILNETFGVFKGAAEPADWFLTDGGHFENTGAYALLAERAEVIVLADCGADPNYAFGDLENLVRKARIDLQADIDFLRPIASKAPAQSSSLAAFGSLNDLASPTSSACLALAKVTYGGDRPGQGILVVIKPNLCSGLPVDLVNFKAENPDFPQHTTADQFFSEAQWESYFLLGRFLGSHLTRHFIEELVYNCDAYFETDDASGLDKRTGAAKKDDKGSATPGRLPARIAATAVGTTLSLGAVATVAVSAWQAIEAARDSSAKKTADERSALKELADLWAKLPPGGSPSPDASFVAARLAYGQLASALVRTADTLCPAGDAGWFNRSPLAARISRDAIEGCRGFTSDRPAACSVLVEAANPNLRGLLPTCLSWEATKKASVPPPRYWAYDYSLAARVDAMHPCDPLRAQLLKDEAEHEAAYGRLTERQSVQTYGGGPQPAQACIVPEAERPHVEARAAVASGAPASVSAPAPSGGTAAAGSAPMAVASAASQPSRPLPSSQDGDEAVCLGVTVYTQTFGPSQVEAAKAYGRAWRQQLGANVTAVEDVLESARESGRPTPPPLRKTVVRFHDGDSLACARRLGPKVGERDWVVEPLSARYVPSRKTVEVWLAP